MSRVITFSRTFPSYHPRAGEATHFIEKVVGGLVARDVEGCDTPLIKSLRDSGLLSISVLNEITKGTYSQYKHHTIRAGHRWKEGDRFSPRVWSDKPYRSKQIQFAPEIEIKKIWDIEFDEDGCLWVYSDKEKGPKVLHTVAKNDGLSLTDLMSWFNKPFTGQIICWNENINY